MKFSHSFRVFAEDIDEQGHVNNVAYLRWVQNVAVAHWFDLTNAEQREKFTWVVTRHEIDYKKPAFESEEITSSTWVGAARTATCERFTEIKRGADLLVQARSIWCLLDRQTSRPTRISSELKELFQMR
jgi:acyl-CoA thioester hydrolase